jgi:hypothetical protein
MVDRIPSLEDVGGQSWSHDWYPYESYKALHYSYTDRLCDEGLIVSHSLSITETPIEGVLQIVRIQGRIQCAYGVEIAVTKQLDVLRNQNGYMVKGRLYNYQAWFSDTEHQILRYDNSHDENDLHCHVFDILTGEEVLKQSIYKTQLPTLSDFVRIAVQRAGSKS